MSVTSYVVDNTVGAVDQFLTNTAIDPDKSRVGRTLLFVLTMSLVAMVSLSGFAILSGIVFAVSAGLFAVVPLGVAKFISISVILVLCAVVIIGAVGLAAPRNQPV